MHNQIVSEERRIGNPRIWDRLIGHLSGFVKLEFLEGVGVGVGVEVVGGVDFGGGTNVVGNIGLRILRLRHFCRVDEASSRVQRKLERTEIFAFRLYIVFDWEAEMRDKLN